ncbi:MAG: hypothetical protein KJZ62_03310 [Fimbriimonadaceae bacterium]|nr:hypothetical protein [Fimbriimonadaceae bacterium]QOJ10935.1 MAG: hypothetical protein HRU74_02320 [Chthonomonadaceae bacterium]
MLSIWLALAIHASTDPAPGVRGRPAEPQITLTLRARSLKSALEELSAKSGTLHEVAANMESEPLIVHVKDVPLDLLREKIAHATHADWEKTDKGYLLRRSKERMALLKAEYTAQRLRWFQEAQQKLRRELESERAYSVTEATAGWARLQGIINDVGADYDTKLWERGLALQTQTPPGRLARRIAANLDPLALVQADVGRRVVFASNPTKTQRPLPLKLEPLMAEYEKECRAWLEAAPQGERAPVPNLEASLNRIWSSGPGKALQLRKVIAVLESGRGGSDTLSVNIVDTEGSYLSRVRVLLSPSPWLPMNSTKSDEDPLTVGAVTREALRRIRWANASPTDPPLPPPSEALKNIQKRPDQHDPCLFVDEVLLEYAQRLDANLVASPSDAAAMIAVTRFGGDTVTPSVLRTFLSQRAANTSLEESQGWLVIRTASGYFGILSRINRQQTARLAAEIAQGEMTLVDSLARLAATPGLESSEFSACVEFLAIVDVGILRGIGFPASFESLRLHGSLSPKQKQVLLAGESIPFRLLDPNVRSAVEDVVFQSDISIETPGSLYDPEGSPEPWNTIATEVTEVCPNGLPSDGSLRLDVTTKEIVEVQARSRLTQNVSRFMMEPQGLASMRLEVLHPDTFGDYYGRYDVLAFVIGSDQEWTYTMQLTDRSVMKTSLVSRHREPRGYPRYEDLPAALRDKVEAVVKRRLQAAGIVPPN